MARLSSRTTTDHDEIRRWAEERGGKPASVAGTGRGEGAGILRIDFPPYGNQGNLEDIGWDDWFSKFDESNLEFLYEDKAVGGGTSYFNKLISRGSARKRGSESGSSRSRSQTGGRKSSATTSRKRTSGRKSTSRACQSGSRQQSGGDGRKASSRKSLSARGRRSSAGRASTKRARTSASSSRSSRRSSSRSSSARKSSSRRSGARR